MTEPVCVGIIVVTHCSWARVHRVARPNVGADDDMADVLEIIGSEFISFLQKNLKKLRWICFFISNPKSHQFIKISAKFWIDEYKMHTNLYKINNLTIIKNCWHISYNTIHYFIIILKKQKNNIFFCIINVEKFCINNFWDVCRTLDCNSSCFGSLGRSPPYYLRRGATLEGPVKPLMSKLELELE